MDTQIPAPLVHFYDTRSHAIPCGIRGFEQRSTKHPRQVTCDRCAVLLAERPPVVEGDDAVAAP